MREAHVTISDSEFDTMGIAGLVLLCREAGIRDFEELVCHGTGAIVQVTVETQIDGDRLSSIECVDQWEHVEVSNDAHLYIIAFTAPDLPETLSDKVNDLVGTCDPEVSDRGATMSLVGSQEAISDTIDEYETAGISTTLRKFGAYAGREQPLDELTDRQREVIRTAYDMGYYEVPRAVTTEDIAAELGVDPSTVAEHLQRAERNLVSYHL
ncbi:helix-turn-helix domain-containing protein [Haladaptatus salinisoli]|uniref:helix-turn-helix domain-containing protein n=1 Tax=Haladaptatus salinisoli TaxID=2884876 RepID=UPI001D09F5D3|nr:helix-turn-helix domain-containing protein [Haladaptatus salinisoli]